MSVEPARPKRALPEERILELLAGGELEVLGLLPRASNATLLCRVSDDEVETLAVYKPQRGERPLWDFPRGTLCLREYAAWVLDRELGWGLVPPTVLREAAAGFGAVQLYVEQDLEADVFELPATHPPDLKRMCAFDLVANNADRKAGHCIVDTHGRLWSVDHGICFHAEDKLRTVIWAFEGEPVPDEVVADLRSLCDRPGRLSGLESLLDPDEIAALRERIEGLLGRPRFPSPGPGRHLPWPPW